MNLVEWSKSNLDYGRKLVDSAVEGARAGEEEFLEVQEEALVPYLEESARQALAPAAVGACLGLLGGYVASSRKSVSKTLAFGVLGGLIGFGAGMIWENREFTARIATGAWKRVGKTRDEHWFENNPIDYA
jgi:hypothetical protein